MRGFYDITGVCVIESFYKRNEYNDVFIKKQYADLWCKIEKLDHDDIFHCVMIKYVYGYDLIISKKDDFSVLIL